MNRASPKRKKAYWWGQGAEWVAMVLLILKGYRILDRRFKCKVGEIDLIAQKGQVLCFIEVKARKHKRDALEALSFHQRQRIISAAQWYLAKCSNEKFTAQQDISCRFDLMAVEPWRIPTHVIDAWQTEG